MKTISSEELKENLDAHLNSVGDKDESVAVVSTEGKRAVLIPEHVWISLQINPDGNR